MMCRVAFLCALAAVAALLVPTVGHAGTSFGDDFNDASLSPLWAAEWGGYMSETDGGTSSTPNPSANVPGADQGTNDAGGTITGVQGQYPADVAGSLTVGGTGWHHYANGVAGFQGKNGTVTISGIDTSDYRQRPLDDLLFPPGDFGALCATNNGVCDSGYTVGPIARWQGTGIGGVNRDQGTGVVTSYLTTNRFGTDGARLLIWEAGLGNGAFGGVRADMVIDGFLESPLEMSLTMDDNNATFTVTGADGTQAVLHTDAITDIVDAGAWGFQSSANIPIWDADRNSVRPSADVVRFDSFMVTDNVIPEPASAMLALVGALAIAGVRRRLL